jgi:hypothetical protein
MMSSVSSMGTALSSNALRQILAFDEFHRQECHARAFFEAVNGGNVRMTVRRGLWLRAKTREPIVIAASAGGRILMATWRFSFVAGDDLPHPAFADQPVTV